MSQLKLFELLQRQRTLMMSTISPNNVPTVSYAPFVYIDKSFFVYISRLARHTQNLHNTQQVTLMAIEDEGESDNIFARRRLTVECAVSGIGRENLIFEQIMESMSKRFGKVFEVIRPLADFELFRLTPMSGRFVQGFGQAFAVNADLQLCGHIGPRKTDPTQKDLAS